MLIERVKGQLPGHYVRERCFAEAPALPIAFANSTLFVIPEGNLRLLLLRRSLWGNATLHFFAEGLSCPLAIAACRRLREIRCFGTPFSAGECARNWEAD